MKGTRLLVIGSVLACVVISVQLLRAQQQGQGKVHMYVGVSKCRMCHRSAARGDQYSQWQSTLHARAYEILASEDSRVIARKAGIEGDPRQSGDCLKCHVAAYDAPAGIKRSTFTLTEGVSCEACHGPGSDYITISVKNAIANGTLDPQAVGLLQPTEKICLECHNKNSPTYKEFNYEEQVKKVLHPVPEKK